jgi:hypothetical protein
MPSLLLVLFVRVKQKDTTYDLPYHDGCIDHHWPKNNDKKRLID